MYDELADEREAYEQGLRLSWEHEDDYDPLLGEIGGLACLYYAYCVGCRATYPGPFRVPPVARQRAGPSPPGQADATTGQEADAA
jgi:hypothetical protein